MLEWIEQFKYGLWILGIILVLPFAYRLFFVVLGHFKTKIFLPAKNLHRYGIVIAARNEESVIGALLDSIHRQDYPAELLTVFVAADNCTDRTASIARSHGAVCYERSNTQHRTKGYALQFLFRCIERDYGTTAFDGFFVFDADNLLAADYISRMNDAFDAGEKIVTSYRNTKNFGENWISCSYGIHWLGTVRFEHRARSFLKLSTRLQGTGYLFDRALVQAGWNYTSLTEDRQLTADAVCRGWRISYQGAAQFFDEQPTRLRIALRQRLRWSRGHLEVFLQTGGIFFREWLRRCFLPRRKQADPEGFRRLRDVFICYDIFLTVAPDALISSILKLLNFVVCIVLMIGGGVAWNASVKWISMELLLPFAGSYAAMLTIPLYVLLTERKRIPAMPRRSLIFGILLWPLFPIIGNVTMFLAAFRRVEWKPIPHHDCPLKTLSKPHRTAKIKMTVRPRTASQKAAYTISKQKYRRTGISRSAKQKQESAY